MTNIDFVQNNFGKHLVIVYVASYLLKLLLITAEHDITNGAVPDSVITLKRMRFISKKLTSDTIQC